METNLKTKILENVPNNTRNFMVMENYFFRNFATRKNDE